MKHATAVGHLRRLVEALGDEAGFARSLDAQPPVLAAYAFGAVLDGPDRLERTEVALVVERPARDLPWGSDPPEVLAMLERHGLAKLPLWWACRPSDVPVANQRIVRPLRIWSVDGPDDEALDAIAARRAEPLRPPAPDEAELAQQLEREAALVLAALDELVHGFHGDPRTVAVEVFDLAWGYTDLRRGLAVLRGEQPAAQVTESPVQGARGGDVRTGAQAPAGAWTAERYQEMRAAVDRRDGRAVMALLDDEPLDDIAQLAGAGLLTALAQGVPGAAPAAERCAGTLRARAWWGDDELAEELEAAVGAGPIPARRKAPVDLDELGSHLEGGGGPLDSAMRLELATGELWPDLEDFEAMTGEPLPEHWEDPDAWLDVEPQGSRDAYRDMERFAATVADRRLADRLDRALEGRGAFRRFREVLADHPDEQARWQVVSDERVRGRARSWLAAHGYRPA